MDEIELFQLEDIDFLLEKIVEWHIKRSLASIIRNPKIDFKEKQISNITSIGELNFIINLPNNKEFYIGKKMKFCFNAYDNSRKIWSGDAKKTPFVSGNIIFKEMPGSLLQIFSVSLLLEDFSELSRYHLFVFCLNSKISKNPILHGYYEDRRAFLFLLKSMRKKVIV